MSKKRNHLLKSPFVIHPGTGRVCVPVDPSKVDDFDPTKVPTVGQLLRELDKPRMKSDEDESMEVDVQTEDASSGPSGSAKRSEPGE